MHWAHRARQSRIISPARTPNLITSAKSLLPCKIMWSQVPGMRMWTSLGTLIQPATGLLPISPSLGRSQKVFPLPPPFSWHPPPSLNIQLRKGATGDQRSLPPQLARGPEESLLEKLGSPDESSTFFNFHFTEVWREDLQFCSRI